MTEKMIENRIKRLRDIEAQQKELETAAEAIRAELKADLEEKGLDELKTKNFILRSAIVSHRLSRLTARQAHARIVPEVEADPVSLSRSHDPLRCCAIGADFFFPRYTRSSPYASKRRIPPLATGAGALSAPSSQSSHRLTLGQAIR